MIEVLSESMLPLAVGGGHTIEVSREWDLTASQMVWRSLGIIFFVLLNAFFVAAEFAIVKVRSSQLEAAIADGSKRARLARREVQHLDGYLSATQLGITLASIALGTIGEPFLARVLAPALFKLGLTNEAVIRSISFFVGFGTITFLHVVLGELMPKSLAIRKSLATTLTISGPLHVFYVVFKPAIWILNGTANFLLKRVFGIETVSESELAHSEEELRHIVSESGKSKEVTETEKDILLNALELNDRCVRDVMTPRNGVVSLDVEDDFQTNLELAIESKHTRFPLVNAHLDDALGLIHIKDLLPLLNETQPDLRRIKRDILIVPEMLPIDQLLHRFRERRAHLALAVDEYGGAVGIVTFDNVMEEIVGEIQDEFDEAEKPEFERQDRNAFVAAGTLSLHELGPLAGIHLESEEVSTIGGYVTHQLGHLPKAGEKIELQGYRVTVTEADERRILQLRFQRMTQDSSTKETD